MIITWNIFFDFALIFLSFSLLNRVLTFLAMIISVRSHFHACKPHSVEFDKLLQALTRFDLKS